jgi:multicomponent Na+:H+ antiporter subunit A
MLAYPWGKLRGLRYLHSLPLLVLSLYFLKAFLGGESHLEDYGSLLPIFDLRLLGDPLSYLLGALIAGLGFGIALYSYSYFEDRRSAARFHALLYFFAMAMLGVVFSENLLLLFVFWELTGLSSYLLIGFDHQKVGARHAAQQALLVTGVGALAMLAGLLIWAAKSGTLNWSELVANLESGALPDNVEIIAALILLGALTKSAQFPLHFWLPNAMQAPTPASSYLHSATMVKAGVFLLLRLAPLLSATEVWSLYLPWIGGLTLVVASLLCLVQSDLKRLLAYTTLAALGLLVMLLGLSREIPDLLVLTLYFALAHALYKAPLFLVVGNIEHATAKRDFDFLWGLRQKLPGTFAAATLACLGLTAFLPTLSFASKEAILARLWGQPLALGALLLSSLVFSYVAFVFLLRVFGLGPSFRKWNESAQENAPLSFAVPLVMGLVSVLLGVTSLGYLSERSVVMTSTLGFGEPVELHLWGGWSLELALSLGTLLLGYFLYLGMRAKHEAREELLRTLSTKGPARFYDFALELLLKGSKKIFRFFQHGYFPYYALTLFAFLLFLFHLSLGGASSRVVWETENVLWYEWVVAGLIMGGAFLALRSQTSLAALTALGLVGFGIAFFYLIVGAPDLALTQFLVETLALVLLVLSFRVLPKDQIRPTTPYAIFAALVAGLFAFLVAYVTLLAAQEPERAQIRDYFGDLSLLAAHGRNVVNVIIVDFRGFDTMGEITVLSIAAVGVLSLLRWKKARRA